MASRTDKPKKTSLDILVPCYNEEINIPHLFESFDRFVITQGPKWEIYLIIIDNGSSDNTRTLAESFITQRKNCRLVGLSRNFGKEASLSAGMFESTSDFVVPIDADLQDPIEVISDMLEQWKKLGSDVVLGRRKQSIAQNPLRRLSSVTFSKIFSSLADVDVPVDVGEFRLMTRKVVDAFCALPESQRYVRGLFAWMGFKTSIIEFERKSRNNGRSKFTFLKLLDLGINGIVSFSTKPLRILIATGFGISLTTFALGFWVLIRKILGSYSIPGYTSLAFLVSFLGGMQLFTLGLVGEYVGKAMLEAKRRPLYFIDHRFVSSSEGDRK